MRTVGSPGVGLATALETVFPPVPSELVLPLAGYTASQGYYSVGAAIAWATAGSLLGALVLYWLGAAWGLERICALADRVPLMHADDVRRAVAWFGRNGRTAVFFGRLVPGVRSLVSIPAGRRPDAAGDLRPLHDRRQPGLERRPGRSPATSSASSGTASRATSAASATSSTSCWPSCVVVVVARTAAPPGQRRAAA